MIGFFASPFPVPYWLADWLEANQEFIREVGNGTWFTLSFAMVIFLFALAVHRSKMVRTNFYWDYPFQIALALSVFVGGSCLRAGYIWLLLHCQSFDEDCTGIEGASWVMGLAVVMAVLGGLCLIRILSPPQWRPWSWLLCGLVATSIPAVYYLM